MNTDAENALVPYAPPALKLERPHHDYSPSTLQSLEACPCYQSKQSDTPHPRTVIGQISHGVTETGEDNPELGDEDIAKVAECIDFYEGRKKNMELAGPVEELKETYLCIDDLEFVDMLMPPYAEPGTQKFVRGTTAGYIDCALINHAGNCAEIFDWKFGFWPCEEAKNNLQGIAYALGLFRAYPELQSIRYFFKQPNLDYITDHVLTRENIPDLYLRIQVVVAKAREARQTGDFKTARAFAPACNFCAHIACCPVVTALVCKVGSKFSPLDIPSDITPTMVHNEADTKLGFQLASVVEVWAKAYRGVVTNRVQRIAADPPAGYRLEARTPRELKDPVKYKEVALRYLTEAEYESTLKATFGGVEKLISDKAPRGQKESTVEAFGQELEACGAVAKKPTYTFLRAIPQKPTNETTNQ